MPRLGMNIARAGAAPFQYFTYREEGRVFQDVGLWTHGHGQRDRPGRAGGSRRRSSRPTGCCRCSAPQPLLGRLFTKADDRPGTPETVILTAGYWRSKFGGDRSAIGRTRDARQPPARNHRRAARYVPLPRPQGVAGRALPLDRSKVFLGQFSFSALARLKPGTTMAQANADVARMLPISLADSRRSRAAT